MAATNGDIGETIVDLNGTKNPLLIHRLVAGQTTKKVLEEGKSWVAAQMRDAEDEAKKRLSGVVLSADGKNAKVHH